MSIVIDTETELNFDFDYKKIINDVIIKCLDYEGCPYETDVNVLFVDSASMALINKEQRNIDKTTDVLSFPLLEYKEAGNFDFLEDDLSIIYFDPESGNLNLGDIVLNVDRIASQALEYGHSRERELAFLTAHSMMHLMGYDHMTEDEAKVMEKKQEEVLSLLGITRDC